MSIPNTSQLEAISNQIKEITDTVANVNNSKMSSNNITIINKQFNHLNDKISGIIKTQWKAYHHITALETTVALLENYNDRCRILEKRVKEFEKKLKKQSTLEKRVKDLEKKLEHVSKTSNMSPQEKMDHSSV